MRGIKQRLVGSYLLIIFLTVVLFEVFLILAVRTYYYGNIEGILKNQITVAAHFYHDYLPDYDLAQEGKELLPIFRSSTEAQILILNSKGKVLADSNHSYVNRPVLTTDVVHALQGEVSTWIGKMENSEEKVLAVSHPIYAGSEITGTVRFVTSLVKVNEIIWRIGITIFLMGCAVIAITAMISYGISRTITNPLKEITETAKLMAAGKFQARASQQYDDEFGQLARTLHYMADEIQRHEQLKNEFIASVSHDLRTPLTSIKGWAITLQSGETVPRDVLDGLEIIEAETERLTLLVEDLLDFSNLASHQIQLNKDSIALREFLGQMLHQIKPRADRKQIQLLGQYSSTIPSIAADRSRLKQVLINLLDNALKFTPENGMIVLAAENKNGGLSIKVIDNGDGIAVEEIAMVTEKFYKGKHKASGSGLGLSICKEIIELHGGKLRIDSVHGEGTEVEIWLPV